MDRQLNVVRLEDMHRYGFGVDTMKSIKVCAYCGAMSDASQFFCSQCSRVLPADTMYEHYRKRHRHCTQCGTVVRNGTRFCPSCGQELEKSSTIG